MDTTTNGSKGREDSKKPSEESPLLADEALGVEEEPAGTDEAEEPAEHSLRRKAKRWLSISWQGIRAHLAMVAIILLLIGGLIALCVYFAFIYQSNVPSKPAIVCLTPACVVAASQIIENMSPRYQDIDPCTDFDKYVCEGFNEKHDLRADQGGLFTGTIMAENAQQILRHVLENPYSANYQTVETDSSAKRKIFEKLQVAYDACMNETEIKDVGSAPLLEVLRKIEALFPIGKSEMAEAFPSILWKQQDGRVFNGENHLSRTVTYLTSIGVSALVDITATADDKDPDVVVPVVSAPRSPGLPSKEYYKDAELVTRYGQVIGRVLEALLEEAKANSVASVSSPNAFIWSKNLVERIVAFELKLAEATPDTADAEDPTYYYNPYSLEETRALLPQLSLHYLISELGPSNFRATKLIVSSPSYMRSLSSTLGETTPETLRAYFVWKTVQNYVYRIEDDALKPLKRFNNEIQGKDPDASEERWRTCVRSVNYGLGWILSKFFVEKAFSEDAKNFGDDIVSDIKAQFAKKLQAVEWMSKDVQKLGVEKVHNIVQKIGYPTKSPDIRDSAALQEYYDSVHVNGSAYFSNELTFVKFDAKQQWSALGKPTDRDEWGMTANTVNAYYNPAGNEIVFPAGIMQAPVFYDPSVPQYLSYGAFGSVSGHELSHAFDSTGRHFDETGNFTDWWDNKTVEAFKEKAQCFVEQYGRFIVPNPNGEPLHVNGKLTLGENIADAGGLNAAFLAWKENEAKGFASQVLPGLQHFTKEQMFFISYANWWCGKTRPEAAVNAIYRDPHAPIWARILGTMANSRDFRETFSCPSKEPTCELW